MRLSLSSEELQGYVARLLDVQFPDGSRIELDAFFDHALDRLEHCFKHVALRGYGGKGEAHFDHLFGDQFASFVYFLANSAWKAGHESAAKKLTLLNRMRHAILIMHDTVLPDIFVLPHTVGTVIGKGRYGDYLVVCQNVTIANDITTTLTFGQGVILFPGAFVVGTGTIGSGSVITANSTVSYTDVPADSMVRGSSPNLEMWPRTRDLLSRFFFKDA